MKSTAFGAIREQMKMLNFEAEAGNSASQNLKRGMGLNFMEMMGRKYGDIDNHNEREKAKKVEALELVYEDM
jgi:hypothetical protein